MTSNSDSRGHSSVTGAAGVAASGGAVTSSTAASPHAIRVLAAIVATRPTYRSRITPPGGEVLPPLRPRAANLQGRRVRGDHWFVLALSLLHREHQNPCGSHRDGHRLRVLEG